MADAQDHLQIGHHFLELVDGDTEGTKNLKVVGDGGGGPGGSNDSVGENGDTAPASSTQIAFEDDDGNLQQVTTAHPLPISGTISATTAATAASSAPSYSAGAQPLSQTLAGDLRVIAKQMGSWAFAVDQTTPGTTNAVDILNLPTNVAVNSGNKDNNTLRVVLANDQPSVAVTGTFWQATQPVSAASLPLPTGAAIAAKQPALGTAGSAAADVISIQGIVSMTPLAVTGTFWQTTQPVSAASLPLPTGAALAANQTNTQGVIGAATAPASMCLSGGVYNSTPLTLTNGQSCAAQFDANGYLKTNIAAALPAGSNLAADVGIQLRAGNGLSTSSAIMVASTNATSVKGSAGAIGHIRCFNNSANIAYLKLYNKATAPTVGTDTPVDTIMIPGNAAGAGVVFDIAYGQAFSTGIAYAVTSGIGASDTGAVAASAFIVTILYK